MGDLKVCKVAQIWRVAHSKLEVGPITPKGTDVLQQVQHKGAGRRLSRFEQRPAEHSSTAKASMQCFSTIHAVAMPGQLIGMSQTLRLSNLVLRANTGSIETLTASCGC